MPDFALSLIGGILIGTSATLMLLLHGRVAGITGIVVGATLDRARGDWLWRVLFLAGLFGGGMLMLLVAPGAFGRGPGTSTGLLVLAGLLVGFGTRLGSGCTSGHGVCGISRLSRRSLVATGTFMLAGIATVFVMRHVIGGAP